MTESETAAGDPPRAASSRPLPFDPDHYAEHLDGLDITEEEANRFLLALWHICQSFVDLGFGLEPDPHSLLPCVNFRAMTDADRVQSGNANTTESEDR